MYYIILDEVFRKADLNHLVAKYNCLLAPSNSVTSKANSLQHHFSFLIINC